MTFSDVFIFIPTKETRSQRTIQVPVDWQLFKDVLTIILKLSCLLWSANKQLQVLNRPGSSIHTGNAMREKQTMMLISKLFLVQIYLGLKLTLIHTKHSQSMNLTSFFCLFYQLDLNPRHNLKQVWLSGQSQFLGFMKHWGPGKE